MSKKFSRETRKIFRKAEQEVDEAGLHILHAVEGRQPSEIVYCRALLYADALREYLTLTNREKMNRKMKRRN